MTFSMAVRDTEGKHNTFTTDHNLQETTVLLKSFQSAISHAFAVW